MTAALIALLAACGAPRPATPTTPPAVETPSSVSPGSSATPARVPPRVNLASEQVRLAGLFRGTPVVFAMQQDGSLRVTVPLRFSFDAGAVKVKPALAAVLSRLAKSQAQTLTRLRVSASAEPGVPASSTLARDRSASLRDDLVSQRIDTARVQIGAKPPMNRVEIVVSEAAR